MKKNLSKISSALLKKRMLLNKMKMKKRKSLMKTKRLMMRGIRKMNLLLARKEKLLKDKKGASRTNYKI